MILYKEILLVFNHAVDLRESLCKVNLHLSLLNRFIYHCRTANLILSSFSVLLFFAITIESTIHSFVTFHFNSNYLFITAY